MLGASMAPLLHSVYGYGLGYGSYLWAGHGMYAQLWAMHLAPVVLACVWRTLTRGTGMGGAVLALVALILSHLIYAYIMGIASLAVLAWAMTRQSVWLCCRRFAAIWGLAVGLSAYFWLPWLLTRDYVGLSPYLERWKYDSWGARAILVALGNGDLFDAQRFPTLTEMDLSPPQAAPFER